MTKKQLKEILEEDFNRQSKLSFVKHLNDTLKCGLKRGLYDLANEIWDFGNPDKKWFNKLWNLFTDEEKLNLRKYNYAEH